MRGVDSSVYQLQALGGAPWLVDRFVLIHMPYWYITEDPAGFMRYLVQIRP